MIRTLSLLAATALLLSTAELRAEERDPASAQALFDQGVELASAGKYAEACPKLAESQRLDPGIGTQFHLAGCYEHVGKIASAWALFLEVASVARASNQTDRENVATTRARRLESRLPRLTIVVSDEARASGLEVRRDGVIIGSAQWGTPLPVDPGAHEIVVSAAGKRPESRTVSAAEAERVTFEVPKLTDAPAEAAPPAGAPAETSTAQGTTSSSNMPLVLGLGGLGLVGIGVGTAFALMAQSDNQDSLQHCRPDDPNRCNQQGVTLRDSALAKGNVATVAFAVGGAALASAGVVWLLSGPSDEQKTGVVDAGVVVAGSDVRILVRGAF